MRREFGIHLNGRVGEIDHPIPFVHQLDPRESDERRLSPRLRELDVKTVHLGTLRGLASQVCHAE